LEPLKKKKFFKESSNPKYSVFKAQAEANAESATQKVITQDRILAEEIDKLEQKKLTDMKVGI
jgi:hypothetical protein